MGTVRLLESPVEGTVDLHQQAERERPGKTRQRHDQQDDGRLQLPPAKVGQRLSNRGVHWTATRIADELSSVTWPSTRRITALAYFWATR